ncbi:hypothetical protein ABT030_03235 [Streptomyces mirabilis]|uniref:hypothetical protein n=1 Tax=Streptomyces mirabilis TaxID=68239 RepID=UPI00332663D9
MDATVGIFDQRTRTFYAVAVDNPLNPTAVQAARWDQKAATWAWENKKKVLNALIEIAPTVIQGIANLMPDGKGKTIVNAVGVAAQAGTLGHETVYAVKNQLAGGAAHPLGAAAMTARGVALGFNIAAAVTKGKAHDLTNSLGTALSMTAATAMIAKPKPEREQVYQQGANRANLARDDEYELGSIRPGYWTPETPQSPSDASLQARVAATATGYSSALAGPANALRTSAQPSAAAVAYTPTGPLSTDTPTGPLPDHASAGTYTPKRTSSEYSTRQAPESAVPTYQGKGKAPVARK